MNARPKRQAADTPAAPEQWATDGRRVWRAPGGPTVCVIGDPGQGELFADVEMQRLYDAELIARAPQLRAALVECAKRLETCCHHNGITAEYAHAAVKGYRDLIAATHGQHGREG